MGSGVGAELVHERSWITTNRIPPKGTMHTAGDTSSGRSRFGLGLAVSSWCGLMLVVHSWWEEGRWNATDGTTINWPRDLGLVGV